jgi:hypothetical protein
MRYQPGAMRVVVALLAASVGGIGAFPVTAVIAAVLLLPLKRLLCARGVHFDPDEDSDRNTNRMIAATIGVAVALGVGGAVIGAGEIIAAAGGPMRAAGLLAAAVAGACGARWGLHGFAGLSAYAFVIPATLVGAAVAGVVAALG